MSSGFPSQPPSGGTSGANQSGRPRPSSKKSEQRPTSQFKSDTRGESERIALLSNIDIFEEYNVKDKLVRIRNKLKGNFPPLLTLVRDRFDAMQDLGQYSSAGGMLDAHNSYRDQRNIIFRNLRSADPEFDLYAQNGQPIRPGVHNLSAFSFCTNTCVGNCKDRDGIGTDNMTDLDNHCLTFLRNYLFYAALQDGRTEVSSPSLAAELFNRHVDECDFYLCSSSGNDYETMLEDLESLFKHEGGGLSLEDFTSAMHLESMLNIMERVNYHFVVHGTPMNVINNSFRNHEKGLKGQRAMSTSPNGVVKQHHFPHTQYIAQGGLMCLDEEEVVRIASEFAAWMLQFDGCKLSDGTAVQFKEEIVEVFMRLAGLRGGKNAHDRAMLAELRKKMSEDQADAAARFHQLMRTTDNTIKENLVIIEREFDTRTMKHVKAWVEHIEALALFRQLEENHPEWKIQKTLAELEKSSMFTDMANARRRKVIKWVKSAVEIPYAKVKYDELIESMNPNDALAIIEASGEFSDGTISWLQSCKAERSEVMTLYNELKAKNKSPDACIAEIVKLGKVSDNTISWLKSYQQIEDTNLLSHLAAELHDLHGDFTDLDSLDDFKDDKTFKFLFEKYKEDELLDKVKEIHNEKKIDTVTFKFDLKLVSKEKKLGVAMHPATTPAPASRDFIRMDPIPPNSLASEAVSVDAEYSGRKTKLVKHMEVKRINGHDVEGMGAGDMKTIIQYWHEAEVRQYLELEVFSIVNYRK